MIGHTFIFLTLLHVVLAVPEFQRRNGDYRQAAGYARAPTNGVYRLQGKPAYLKDVVPEVQENQQQHQEQFAGRRRQYQQQPLDVEVIENEDDADGIDNALENDEQPTADIVVAKRSDKEPTSSTTTTSTTTPSFFERKHGGDIAKSLPSLQSAPVPSVRRNQEPPRPHRRHEHNGRRRQDEEFRVEGAAKPRHEMLQALAMARDRKQQEQQTTEEYSTGPRTPLDDRIDLLKSKVAMGKIEVFRDSMVDYVPSYGLKQSYTLRYSPPPKSEPWPMPQVFIGHEELLEFDANSLVFEMANKTVNFLETCPTLRAIVERYHNGLLVRSARQLAIDDAILHPGHVYLPSVEFPANLSNNGAGSFFERKVVNQRKTQNIPDTGTKWYRSGKAMVPLIIITMMSTCDDIKTGESQEQYGLRVTSNGITISAREVWGVLYALETLSQLVFIDEQGSYMIRSASIEDWPRFKHRGLMLDSSRHFLPLSLIKQNIDAMLQNKFNVFHWHLSDDQSFPLYLSSFPEFAKLAAFSTDEIYTPEDVRELVDYARLRGVRIMPEIDSPSHVFSWRHLEQDVLTRCYENGRPNGDVGPLDPTNEETYRVLAKILKDVAAMFPDAVFHAGGDEVPKNCWMSNPNITEYRRRKFQERSQNQNSEQTKRQQSSAPQLQNAVYGYYQQNEPGLISLQEVVADYNRRLLSIFRSSRMPADFSKLRHDNEKPHLVMWEEAYENDQSISRDVTMHVWKSSQGTVKFLIEEGFRVLFSQCWYLNYINYGLDWIKFYQCDPTTLGQQYGPTIMEDDKGLLGGEVCIWGEYIDETNLMSTLWPRASAVAERLWSNRGQRDMLSAGRRLEEHRCRMIRRGIPAAPISGPGTCGPNAFVSAKQLWESEIGSPSRSPKEVEESSFENQRKSRKINGGQTYIQLNDDFSAKNHGQSFITIRVDYGDNGFSQIVINLSTLYLLVTVLLLLYLAFMVMTKRRKGLKYFRPLMRFLSRENSPMSTGFFSKFATPVRARSSQSFSSSPLSTPSASPNRTSLVSPKKRQNMD